MPVFKVPGVAMQRPGVVEQPQQHGFLPNGYVESVVHERLKRVTIRWKHSGTNVAVVGSWDNWKTTEPLQKVRKRDFVIVKTLPIGVYHYRFIVDGCLRHAPGIPSDFDDSGYPFNILDLQDYVPETQLSDFEDPPSPPSSYDNQFLNEDEFSKPPPEIPPQLPLTIRHEPPPSSNALLSFTHLELNHLYIHRTDGEQFVALRSTYRFQHKYVKTIVYKSLPRER
ncbi:Immunoglobulin-like fold [Sesbania bispinosa]|nr:Immunoglobulin-like fold [Sesbania bispinosa]